MMVLSLNFIFLLGHFPAGLFLQFGPFPASRPNSILVEASHLPSSARASVVMDKYPRLRYYPLWLPLAFVWRLTHTFDLLHVHNLGSYKYFHWFLLPQRLTPLGNQPLVLEVNRILGHVSQEVRVQTRLCLSPKHTGLQAWWLKMPLV